MRVDDVASNNWPGHNPRLPRQALATGMVCAWTARLGAFLLTRVMVG